MARDYSEAADNAVEAGFIDPYHVDTSDIRANLTNFLKVEDTTSTEAQRLLRETTEAVMDQEVRRDDGATAGLRRNLTTWTDVHGNVMYQHKVTGTRKKLVDSSDL